MATEMRKYLLIDQHANYIAEISKVSTQAFVVPIPCLISSSHMPDLLLSHASFLHDAE